MNKRDSTFKPAWWLRSAHAQTIWPFICRKQATINTRRQRFELPDGDFVDLDWVGPSHGPLVLLLHGLEGSVKSQYAQWMLKAIEDHGWRGVLMHFRGCSGEPNRLQRTYHSGDTYDVSHVVRYLQTKLGDEPLMAVGYSLGGNVLLKWLGETGKQNPTQAAVAVSVPFELAEAASRMNQGFSRVYQWYNIRRLRQRLQQKIEIQTDQNEFDWPTLEEYQCFWHFDNEITAPLNGFEDVHDYYSQSSSRQYISAIDTPTLIIHSKDDPFLTEQAIPSIEELSPKVQFELTEKGGHVGFVSGVIPGMAEYWLEQRCINYFNEMLAKS